MSAPNLHADNLIATVDWNGQQIDGTTAHVMDLGDLKAKFEAFKWIVLVLEQGNDIAAIINKLNEAKTRTGKGVPVVVLMKTVMGKGVSFMEGHHEWHGTAPNDAQLAQALTELPETSFGDY
jgi:transketolase